MTGRPTGTTPPRHESAPHHNIQSGSFTLFAIRQDNRILWVCPGGDRTASRAAAENLAKRLGRIADGLGKDW